jgi:hypothetical protein
MRECKTCKVKKLFCDFPERGFGRRECKVCRNGKRKAAYRDKHGGVRRSRWDAIRLSPEESKSRNLDSQRRSKLRLKYGITLEQYDAIVVAQDGRCGICRERKELVVDHCHTKNRVRGLLCSGCNTGIGHLKDDPALLKSAILYLECNPILAAEVIAAAKEVIDGELS